MSSRARIGIVVGAVVVLVVAFIVASGGGDDDNDKTSASTTQQTATAPTSTDETSTDMSGGTSIVKTTTAATKPAEPAIPVVTVKNAKPVGGIQKIKFTKGDTIEFKVVSDTTDEIHFHGYDIGQDVKAGGSTTFKTKATIEGRFVVELEDHEQQIAEVEVDPS
ncbi:hypothetical protein [Baekduia sp. Peel2402]|uniref:hypothetical protein n=1 Tax=Baekduia sp. Peel2402 TaxID=3458296 RepID=UPI00403E9E6F